MEIVCMVNDKSVNLGYTLNSKPVFKFFPPNDKGFDAMEREIKDVITNFRKARQVQTCFKSDF